MQRIFNAWWDTLTNDERAYLRSNYQEFSANAPHFNSGDALKFITMTASNLSKPASRSIAASLLGLGESMLVNSHPIDAHLFYITKIKVHYPLRANKADMDQVLHACEMSIGMAHITAKAFMQRHQFMPSHPGFRQMIIILKKQGDKEKALQLFTLAKNQGWMGFDGEFK